MADVQNMNARLRAWIEYRRLRRAIGGDIPVEILPVEVEERAFNHEQTIADTTRHKAIVATRDLYRTARMERTMEEATRNPYEH